MNAPHKHAALIKAWAFGAEIEVRMEDCSWRLMLSPRWLEQAVYRIKPTPKPDIVYFACFDSKGVLGKKVMLDTCVSRFTGAGVDELKLIFSGETGKLKAAEVI